MGVGPFGAGWASPDPIHHAQLHTVTPAKRQPADAHHLTGFAFLDSGLRAEPVATPGTCGRAFRSVTVMSLRTPLFRYSEPESDDRSNRTQVSIHLFFL